MPEGFGVSPNFAPLFAPLKNLVFSWRQKRTGGASLDDSCPGDNDDNFAVDYRGLSRPGSVTHGSDLCPALVNRDDASCEASVLRHAGAPAAVRQGRLQGRLQEI